MSTSAHAQTKQLDPKTQWELGLITDEELLKYLVVPHPGEQSCKTGPLCVFMPKNTQASPLVQSIVSPLDPRVQHAPDLSLSAQWQAVRAFLRTPHPGRNCSKTGSLGVLLEEQ